MLRIAVPKEILGGERRVALVPSTVAQLKKDGYELLVESGAGESAGFSDEEYQIAGAKLFPDSQLLFAEADLVLKVQPSCEHEVNFMKIGAIYIGFLAPSSNLGVIQKMLEREITAFAMEYMPRIARAQSMDALSSAASIAGYRAVLIAAQYLGKFFPLMMTAAGTIPPARVLVVGAGVAGLQAIATARRLGAIVEAFDVRPEVSEQIKSLGAQLITMPQDLGVKTAAGYVTEFSEELLKKEREVIAGRLPYNNVVITTAQVFGKKAPLLITDEMLKLMKRGSVIVDLASEQGGNCQFSKPGELSEKYGVLIYGASNFPATLATDASSMYSRNVSSFLKILWDKEGNLNFEDEIVKSTCLVRKGEILNKSVKEILAKGG